MNSQPFVDFCLKAIFTAVRVALASTAVRLIRKELEGNQLGHE
ncbi:Unknown protein sequence [Pseudomonas amygdali pv. lachrymans]|uniref:Uncharacterized protein n=1 Tax=Pseudomonas amygdali pv. lachrymans TaxID=53707 RepID=A0ABR5KTU1_PSEAV|nr:Unknown protein sequence [Pseudomonas amygdali pv. lachrymans]